MIHIVYQEGKIKYLDERFDTYYDDNGVFASHGAGHHKEWKMIYKNDT